MKSKQNILFRFSGGKAKNRELGFGHVYRCLSLAESLKEHNLFFLIEDYGGVKRIIKDAGFIQIFKLSKNIDDEYDIKKTIEIIKKKSIDKVIVDKYKIKLTYLRKIKKKSKVIVISDLKRINFPVDLVVNGFIGLKESLKKNQYSTPVLAGIKYQIIDKKFHSTLKSNKSYGLVTSFGGFDEHGISNMVIDEIIKLKPNFKTKIILGPGTKNKQKISSEQKKNLTIIQKTDNIQKEISTAKVGLCSGGLTSYEFASQKIPFGIICQEKHQLQTANEWEKRGIATNLGLIDDKINQKIKRFLEDINDKKRNNIIKKYCDGKGSQRVAEKILELK